MYWACHILIWVNLTFYAIDVLLSIFGCRPVASMFIPVKGTCLNVEALNVTASSINCASDLIILILPQTTIWRLRMPLRKRLAASGVFFIGILYG